LKISDNETDVGIHMWWS